jgi:hypothetical protein
MCFTADPKQRPSATQLIK